jgi:hypothetical protein
MKIEKKPLVLAPLRKRVPFPAKSPAGPRRGRALLALMLFVNAVFSSPSFAADAGYTDVPPGHWASGVIAKWSGADYGVLQGNGDGTFAPSRGITLGELATILSKTFAYTARTPAEVSPARADEYVEKAMAAGIIPKADKIDAGAIVTREQALLYTALAYGVAPLEGETSFADDAAIAAAYKPYVNAFQKHGYIAGKDGGLFDPRAAYTRAEAMQLIENTTSEIADGSIAGRDCAKNLIVRRSGVTVKDTRVRANLIVGQGAGDGVVTLENVKIDGSLILCGGDNEVKGGGAVLGGASINGAGVKLTVRSGASIDRVTVNASGALIGGDGAVRYVTVCAEAGAGVAVLTASTTVTVDANAGAVRTANDGMILPGTTLTTSDGSTSDGSAGGAYAPPAARDPPRAASPASPEEVESGADDRDADDDNDTLPNYIEDLLGLDKAKEDSDGDGLNDGFEFSFLTTELLSPDTDGNGISDADEDFDGDGLTNIREQALGTRPDLYDTDADELSDGDEVHIHGTDPLRFDTDGDGLSDGEEIKLGLNPNSARSDGATPDDARRFRQTTDDSVKDDALRGSDKPFVPSVSGEVPGDISKNVSLERSDNDAFADNRAVLSDVLALQSAYDGPLTLSFAYGDYAGDLRNLAIVSFGENGLAIVDTVIDENAKTLSGEADGDGTYFVVDLDAFLKGLGIDLFADIAQNAPAGPAIAGLDAGNGQPGAAPAGLIDKKRAAKDESAAAPAGTFAAAATSGATGKADIAFVLDTTASMGDDILRVANNINAFVERLATDYNVEANFALITYSDRINEADSTRIHKNNDSNWFTSANAFKREVTRTASEDVGSGRDETPLDGLGMARLLDWRKNSSKFIILLTDEWSSQYNTYGYADIAAIAAAFASDPICVSVITGERLQSRFNVLWESTNGLYGDIAGDFGELLLGLADKIGDITNADGAWVFLDDFQAVKLSDTLANAAANDTDADGLTDAQELGARAEADMLPYIRSLADKHAVSAESYKGKTSLTVWKYTSHPALPDTDYDGIPDGGLDYDGAAVPRDPSPKDGTFTGKLHYMEDDKPKESKQNMEFTVDYRLLLQSNTDYKKNLAVLGSLYAADIYADSYLSVTGGAAGGSDEPTALGGLFGLKDLENIKIDGSNYDTDTDDGTEFVIGHRRVDYAGATREIIVLVVRGTNKTNAEWSSNFDVGADTDEYSAATGAVHPDWVNKSNHKGFDVAANRVLAKVNDYLSRHSLNAGASKAIWITGHSRGAAIANLLGAHFEKDPNFLSFTYTFAAPNPTTDAGAGAYRTIFNIVNQDDTIPYLPLSNWGFRKYGVVKDISVAAHYEGRFGSAEEGTWEWLTGSDYNNDRGAQRTLSAFAKIADKRGDLYVQDGSADGTVWENNIGHITRAGAESELAALSDALRGEKLLRFCSLRIVGGEFQTSYHVEVRYSPAYLMQMLSNMTTKTGPLLGRDVKGKYAAAKASFVASSGKVLIGGMTHPHLPITYYWIAHKNFAGKL